MELCGRKKGTAPMEAGCKEDFAVDQNGIPKLVADTFDKIPVCLSMLGSISGMSLSSWIWKKSFVWFNICSGPGTAFCRGPGRSCCGLPHPFSGVSMRFDLDFPVLVQVMRADPGNRCRRRWDYPGHQDTDGGVRMADTVLLRDRPSGDKRVTESREHLPPHGHGGT